MSKNVRERQFSMPWTWLNGTIVPSSKATVSVFDRSFQIGDGVFDTLRILETCPLNWTNHWNRFSKTAGAFGLKLPYNKLDCSAAMQALLVKNAATNATARIHLSRGVGPRGYSSQRADTPLLVISLHAPPIVEPGVPMQWNLGKSTLPFPRSEVLTQHKTASRIFNVAAKLEADRSGYDDAVLMDVRGSVVEAVSSNIFWIKNDVIFTPSPSLGLLPGITRAAVLKVCGQMGLQCREVVVPVSKLMNADGVFLSMSTNGIIEAVSLDGTKLQRHPLVKELHRLIEAQNLKSSKRFQRARIARR